MTALRELQNYTFISKYARFLEDKNRRETWKEAVDRVRNMMLKKYAYANIDAEINWAYDMMQSKKVLGSQRALQYGGIPIEKNNMRMYNCVASYCDRLRFFQECFWILLCGGGTGFSVQKHHIGKLPNMRATMSTAKKTFTPDDSIEGWADCLGVLMSSYFAEPSEERFREYQGYQVEFDFKKIRKKGSILSSGVGKAPGSEPLSIALEKIRTILDNKRDGLNIPRLKPIEAYDIVMHASDAVLSGGVRRSSTICVFSPDDEEMLTAKTGNWMEVNPQRARSNNSAALLRNTTTYEDFFRMMTCVKDCGEPGFIWVDNVDALFNPCITKDSVIATKDGLMTIEQNIKDKKGFSPLIDGKEYNSFGFWSTGTKPVYEITLSSGRKLKATGNHLVQNGKKEWVRTDSFEPGDTVRIHNHREYNKIIYMDSQEYAQGYLCGSFVGDGNIADDSAELKWWGLNKDEYRKDGLNLIKQAQWDNPHHKTEQSNTSLYSILSSKKLLDFAKTIGIVRAKVIDNKLDYIKGLVPSSLNGNWSYLAGLIAGYVDADGHVIHNPIKGSCIRLTSGSTENLRLVQIALSAFGINSKIYFDRREAGFREMPDGNGGYKNYWCEAVHDLHISGDNICMFQHYIKLKNTNKQKLIDDIVESYKRTPNKTSWVDTVDSIVLLPAEEVYDCTVNDIHAFDANGFYVHNCVEIGMYPRDVETGLSGWQGCNLSTINCGSIKDVEDFYERCRAAAIIGTLQAGFTSFDYLGEVSERIFRREALIGVSMTGTMENYDIVIDPTYQVRGAEEVKAINTRIAKLIGINQAARTTCLKPEGTTSSLLGTSSGIHPHHAKRYIRRVQNNNIEVPYQYFKKFNAHATELSVWSASGTDENILFPIEVADGAKTKNQLPAIEMLKIVKSTQTYWVMTGKNQELCTQPWLNHNVSNTIMVKDEEWDDVTNYIYENREFFTGISLIGESGDKDYPQAPFSAILTSREIVREHGEAAIWCSGLIELALTAFDNNLWQACDAAMKGYEKYEVEKVQYIDICSKVKQKQILITKLNRQLEWITKFNKYCAKYFNSECKKLTYCLKDVHNLKLYSDLKDTIKDIDWTQMYENEDNTKIDETIACAGGACLIA